MAIKIIITRTTIQGRSFLLSCLMNDDHLIEIKVENTDEKPSTLGNIYIGRVQKLVPNINAAFVEIAPGQACYYALAKNSDPIYVRKGPGARLAQNDEILVQLEKESVKMKAPTVSTNLNLTGRYAVLTTENKRIGVSNKIEGEKRDYYKSLIQEQTSGKYGIIVRTNAQAAAAEDVLAEIQKLEAELDHMIQYAHTRTCYSLIRKQDPKFLSFVQNAYSADLTEIVTDQQDVYDVLTEYCGRYSDFRQIPIRLYQDASYPLANAYNLNKQLERATQKQVWLKSGGFLVIEPTEALTVIDVNTGKSNARKDSRTHFMDINREASEEIARQLRLRNISGIIIIDYIDMESREEQKQLLEELKGLVKHDPIPVQVHDITRLNLVEVTRKKVEKSLLEQLK